MSDGGVITASGTASLEFAREIFNAWYTLFKTSSTQALGELIEALGA